MNKLRSTANSSPIIDASASELPEMAPRSYYDSMPAHLSDEDKTGLAKILERYDEETLVYDMVAGGELPDLPSGYALAWDDHEEEVPAQVFTEYFKNRTVPIARQGLKMHEHDTLHILSYRGLFSDPQFADTIQEAAANSAGDQQQCEEFTDVVDQLGDCYSLLNASKNMTSSLAGGRVEIDVTLLLIARGQMRKMITLAHPDLQDPQKKEIEANAWKKLGFEHHEDRLRRRVSDVLTSLISK